MHLDPLLPKLVAAAFTILLIGCAVTVGVIALTLLISPLWIALARPLRNSEAL